MRYIELQKESGHGVNVRFEGLKPEGEGPLNRHGMPRVPGAVVQRPLLDVALSACRLPVAGSFVASSHVGAPVTILIACQPDLPGLAADRAVLHKGLLTPSLVFKVQL